MALVTGAARRIGRVIAERLAEAGFDVVLHASPRSARLAEETARQVATNHGVRCCALNGDLSDIAACERLIPEAVAAFGSLRLLVNNAAVFESDSADSLDLEIWQRQFAVNLRAPAILAQRFAEAADRKTDPLIINIVDQRVLRPNPQFFSYTLTKSALWTATITMAQTFAERGIRVNAIGPGPVLPNALDGTAGFNREIENVPMRHAVDPIDVAEAVLYLAGARSVTGQMIAVDAGQHLSWRTPDLAT